MMKDRKPQTSRRPQWDESQTNTAAPATQHNLLPRTATPAEVLEAITSHLTAKKIVLPPLDWITDNDIDGEVFQTLTTENLHDLGVSSLGARMHILKLQQVTAPVSGTAMREMMTNYWASGVALKARARGGTPQAMAEFEKRAVEQQERNATKQAPRQKKPQPGLVVMARRTGPRGLQWQTYFAGQTEDDAEWRPRSQLKKYAHLLDAWTAPQTPGKQ
ncbi:uncharacterized protein ACA1_256020 [Acanthamoeba castellanii str. Neff]|uniref:SAM domain-containing protein n=1 Tax=Acanthamoeba castellanii (strain ATCC 30010 / Neff) TaxID=1257118 RepID=L8HDJ0_ACACF|nr:uncharacterized protein ACA1_256020 [Acanthamoeba castellanii str. Neff]ELR22461.1 hypothetical protein ACA1_256020 [Acanthamoeba castellanii str. Neff]